MLIACQGWKPWTIRSPILVTFVATSLVITGLLEFLAQKSATEGGLFLSNSPDDISSFVMFVILTVPTTIAVLYSLAFTWIDLDVRRMQPWIELSRPGGATAENSIFLDYPFEFLANVPFKSWRRGHWPVFFAGTVMVLIFWIITPLQAAILGTQQVGITRKVAISAPQTLLPLREQAADMDSFILNSAYASIWLGQQYPAFTSRGYALLPYVPSALPEDALPDEIWDGTTTRYTTELNCWPAKSTQLSPADATSHTFDNGQGCRVNISIPAGGIQDTQSIIYVGWHDNAVLDWALHNPQCGPAAQHQFLAIWAKFAAPLPVRLLNLTASFCETSYMKQNVSVSVSAGDKLPDDQSIIELSTRVPLGPDEFNSTAFEYLLATGVPPLEMNREYPEAIRVEQYPEIFQTGLPWPLTPMVGYGLGAENVSLDHFQDRAILEGAFESAHKVLFSMAVSRIMSNVTEPAILQDPGATRFSQYGIVVNRVFSWVVEGFLVLVAATAAALLIFSKKEPSHLHGDPASIAAIFRLIRNSKALLSEFVPKDAHSDPAMRRELDGAVFKLEDAKVSESSGPCLDLSLRPRPPPEQSRQDALQPTAPARPRELQPPAGIAVTFTLLFGIGVLGYFKSKELELGGKIFLVSTGYKYN